MIKYLEFKMKDGLIIRGQIEGNFNSDKLVVMLHSGGYDRHEHGVKEVINGTKIYYNNEGNYDYLTNLLKRDYMVLRIDQRNHGQSGKNIDIDKLTNALSELGFSNEDIMKIIKAELARNKNELNKFIEKYPNIKDLLNRPIIKDMSFIQMKNDLTEVMESLPDKIGRDFTTIDYIGTCMGTLVLGLYLNEHLEKANSLTLFSPLYTFNYSFFNPPKEAKLLYQKKEAVLSGNQFRLGNAIEGKSTYEEIKKISKDFIKNFAHLNIPVFCIQGLNDVLVSKDEQEKIFKSLEEYKKENGMCDIYYSEIDGVHCLYDSIFPSILEVSEFINANEKVLKK